MWKLRFISTYLKLLFKFNFVIEWRRNYWNFFGRNRTDILNQIAYLSSS